MKRNSRLSVALHVLLHMAEQADKALTSEVLASWAATNPVVIRRTFAGLRDAGIVGSTKGHGGGWTLLKPLDAVSLADIQAALDEPLLALGKAEESPGCLVEQAVNAALDDAVAQARRLLDERLSKITLADLAAQIGPRRVVLAAAGCKDPHHES
ncbi:transcriptional regulator [Caulobacter zeae]|uniref:Transcriptional regulator n=1 Tax=Caulobacter zeae TaxID=2055137 RepID=A0A2N5DEC8_9CAUL|nr:Rrf2 family transcriptional regulator [Caulobacter zeae]PLR24418.1 transcriptional regulator [Caulobacter zeae]